MRIAVVGSGISGLVSAYILSGNHDVTVYECSSYAGGHTHTESVSLDQVSYAVDTGFIVHNTHTYPLFCKLLNHLGVETQDSIMSFSTHCDETGIEYSSKSLNAIFAQRSNIINPGFWGLLRDIIRFDRAARRFMKLGSSDVTLGTFIGKHGFGEMFQKMYLVPMLAAIWSANPETVFDFPAIHFIRFFDNHGLLNVWHRIPWRVIKGGSSQYIEPLTRNFKDNIRLNTPVKSVKRHNQGVDVNTDAFGTEEFEHVVLAVHSDQALRMLADATDTEIDILSKIPYQPNDVLLHTDSCVMPERKAAWASWNYRLLQNRMQRATLTYYMNKLQNLSAAAPFLVTLNDDNSIDQEKVLGRYVYEHPVYTQAAIEAQKRHNEISGINRTHYCGAYWGYGFHEDGVRSALNACQYFGGKLP
jgi:uncharacterized protein